jgi:predicted nuclease with TOPRIM domain
VNDIEKLHQVIDALEEQSSRVTEFNGVLGAVNSAREKIESTKTTLAKFVDEQKDLVSESYKRFEEYGVRLTKLESEVATLGEMQKKTLKEIAALDFVTPEQHEQCRAGIEKAVTEQLSALSEKIDVTSAGQQSAIKSLRTLLVFGVLLLTSGIAFIAKGAFI